MSFAIAAAPTLTADKTEFDGEQNAMVATGDAIFKHDELTLQADTVRFYKGTNTAKADGSVVLNRDTFRMVTPALEYSAKDRRMTTSEFRLGQAPFYLSGTDLTGTTESGDLGNAVIFFNEPDKWSPRIRTERTTYYPDEKVVAEKATFYVGGFPFMRLPQFSYRLSESPLRFYGDLGYRSNLGLYLQTTTLYRTPGKLSYGAVLDFYTNRGVLVGPAMEWHNDKGENYAYSRLRAGYMDDGGNADDIGVDILERPIPEDRWFIDWQHQQDITDALTLTANIQAWSDSDVLREFREDLFRGNQQPDSFVEAVYTGQNYFLSAFGRADLTDFQTIVERLPEVRLDVMPTPVGETGFYASGQASYVNLRKDDDGITLGSPPTFDKFETDRFDAFAEVNRVWRPRPWLTVVPLAGARVTHYTDTTGTDGEFTRVTGQLGFDAEMRMHGLWDVNNDVWEIDGLRHVLRPVVQYRYFPEAQQGSDEILPVDDSIFTTTLPPFDLADIRSIDALTDVSVVRIGLENLLQTRDAGYGSRQLAELSLYQDILLGGTPDARFPGRDWSNLHLDLGLTPAYWLDFDFSLNLDPEGFDMNEIRSQVSITDGDVWSMRLAVIRLEDLIDQYELYYARKLNERWGVRFRWRYDADLSEITDQLYAVRQRLGHSWDIEYLVGFKNGSEREDSVNIQLRVNLLDW